MGPRGRFYSYMHHVIDVGTGVVLRVELPVQRRLCPIFVRNVGSPDIHEYFRGLTVSQRTPRYGASHYPREMKRQGLVVFARDPTGDSGSAFDSTGPLLVGVVFFPIFPFLGVMLFPSPVR